MQIKNKFFYNNYEVYLVKVHRYHINCPKKSRGNKSAYFIYTIMNKNTPPEGSQLSFGCRVKEYKWALKQFENICAHVKTVDKNANNIFPLWNSISYLNDKFYCNKDEVTTYFDMLETLKLLSFNQN